MRFTILLALLFSALPLLADTETSIIGGERVVGREWSQTVCLTYPGEDGTYRAFCSGTLVTPDLVLTAGHCLDQLTDPLAVKVYIGNGKDTGDFEGQFGVEIAEIHPLYRLRDWDLGGGEIAPEANNTYDYAYLRLSRPVPEHMVEIIPVANLEETEQLTAPGSTATVVGFGRRTMVEEEHKIGLKNKLDLKIDGVQGRTEISFAGTSDSTVNSGDSGGPAFGQLPDGSYRILGICSRGATRNGASTYGIARDTYAWALWDSGGDITALAEAEMNVPEEVVNDKTLLARMFLRLDAHSDAARVARQCVAANPNDAEAHAIIAMADCFSFRTAFAHARKAAELDPFQYSRLLAASALMMGDFDLATTSLNEAAMLEPRPSDSLMHALIDALRDPGATALNADSDMTRLANEHYVGSPHRVSGPFRESQHVSYDILRNVFDGPVVNVAPSNYDLRMQAALRKLRNNQRLSSSDWISTRRRTSIDVTIHDNLGDWKCTTWHEYAIPKLDGTPRYFAIGDVLYFKPSDTATMSIVAAGVSEQNSVIVRMPFAVDIQEGVMFVEGRLDDWKDFIKKDDPVIDTTMIPAESINMFRSLRVWYDPSSFKDLMAGFELLRARSRTQLQKSIVESHILPALRNCRLSGANRKDLKGKLPTSVDEVHAMMQAIAANVDEWTMQETQRFMVNLELARIWAIFYSRSSVDDTIMSPLTDEELRTYWRLLVSYSDEYMAG